MQDKYFLEVGDVDCERLSILSELYNPPALRFLKASGLKPGMIILEVGCGTGHMACELAKYLGPKGTVIAIDSSQEQIEKAKTTAQKLGITNIEFHVCDVFDIPQLNQSYDATYGRWVIEFTQEPDVALATMYQSLKPGGILAYEATNILQTAYFSCPENPIIGQWFSNGPKMFLAHGCRLKFGYEVYDEYLKLKCKNIHIETTQPVLKTATEKKVYRLGCISSKPTLLAKKILSEQQIEGLIKEFEQFEKSHAISGFYQNILISGIK